MLYLFCPATTQKLGHGLRKKRRDFEGPKDTRSHYQRAIGEDRGPSASPSNKRTRIGTQRKSETKRVKEKHASRSGQEDTTSFPPPSAAGTQWGEKGCVGQMGGTVDTDEATRESEKSGLAGN